MLIVVVVVVISGVWGEVPWCQGRGIGESLRAFTRIGEEGKLGRGGGGGEEDNEIESGDDREAVSWQRGAREIFTRLVSSLAFRYKWPYS